MSSEKVSRRAALKGLATSLAAPGLAVVPRTIAEAAVPDAESTWGHTSAFGDQYHRGVLAILEAIRRTEMERVAEIAERMAGTLRRGGKVWMQAKQGHMGRYEFDPQNAGNPGILESNSEWDDTDYERMHAGDVLVTNYVNENVRSARDAGVFVVGVPVPYHDSPGAPRGFTKPNPNGWFLSDVSSLILDSHVPYTQGIVDCPEIPEMKLCPSSASPLCALFWMLQAEAADKLQRQGTTGAPQAEAVLDTIVQRTKQAFASQRDRIFGACPEAARRIGRGGHFHVSSEHGGVAREATGVASGPMMTNAFRDKMQEGDVHLLATLEPDAPKILEEAKKARGLGMHVVAIGPGSSHELRGLSDVFLDNLSPEGGLLEIPGFPHKVATVGGVINNVLMWIFTAQLVDEMVRRGFVPWFWMGFFQAGGKEYDDAVRPFFLRQGF